MKNYLEPVKAVVTREYFGKYFVNEEQVFSVPKLDSQLIQKQLMDQACLFSDEEILDGTTFSGIYVDQENEQWIHVYLNTHNIRNCVRENPTTEEIDTYLTELFSNISHGFMTCGGQPTDVKVLKAGGVNNSV